jgi:hypothetical protein
VVLYLLTFIERTVGWPPSATAEAPGLGDAYPLGRQMVLARCFLLEVPALIFGYKCDQMSRKSSNGDRERTHK